MQAAVGLDDVHLIFAVGTLPKTPGSDTAVQDTFRDIVGDTLLRRHFTV